MTAAPASHAHHLKFSRLPGQFAICRLPAGSQLPAWALQGSFVSITRTPDELSIVCPEQVLPQDVRHDKGWVCLKLAGPFAFSQTGILSSFIQPLSAHAISVFAVATFDTDYVLIPHSSIDDALEVLKQSGHELI